MIDRMVYADTLPQAYHHALWVLNNVGSVVDCPDYNTRCKEVGMTMCITEPLKEPMISRCIPCGPEMLQEYCVEMLDGIKDCFVGRGWSYTYHKRMTDYIGADGIPMDQVRFVINELRNNPNSRRAVIDARNNAEDMYSDDPACLQHIQFMVRGGRLDCFVLFRSNDAVKATYMNAFALIQLQIRIACAMGVGVGTYTHRANSFHAYERDWEMLDSYCERIDSGKNLYYSYEEDWKEQMEDAVPEIMKKVKELELC